MFRPALLRNVFLPLALIIFLALPAMAAETTAPSGEALQAEKPAPPQQAPANAAPRPAPERSGTVLGIEHDGKDALGAKLSFQLKELFGNSSRFSLSNNKSEARFKLLLSTQPEFADRPNLGSVYALVWVYSHGDNVLGYYLAMESGVINPEDVDGLAARIAEKTDGIAARYAFLKE